jgi:FKBP-type peptidyl-prolyl cis-trans isomerase 2
MRITHMNNVSRLILIFMGALLVFSCATRSGTGPVLSGKASSAEFEDMKKRLNKAFEEAKQGKRTVVVDLTEDPDIVQKGDLVRVNFTATLEDGTVIHTTRADVAKDATCKKIEDYEEPKAFVPEDVFAGISASIPGLEEVVLGMAAGDKKSVTLAPEKAYGVRDTNIVVEFPRVKTQAKSVRFSPKDYINRYARFPILGSEVNYDVYFNGVVVDVTDAYAELELLPKEKGPITNDFSTTVITEKGEEMEIALTPKIGAPFRAWNKDGKIISSDEEMFTVDFNHPLADESVALDIELVSLTKTSKLAEMEIPWMEDYDEAIAAAKPGGKPILLVLYADWCGFCKKLFDRTMEDPRVKVLKDRFVWLKIDSGKDPSCQESFAQQGFPMIVVMDSQGLVLEKMSGYRDAKTLRKGLEEYLGQTVTS